MIFQFFCLVGFELSALIHMKSNQIFRQGLEYKNEYNFLTGKTMTGKTLTVLLIYSNFSFIVHASSLLEIAIEKFLDSKIFAIFQN